MNILSALKSEGSKLEQQLDSLIAAIKGLGREQHRARWEAALLGCLKGEGGWNTSNPPGSYEPPLLIVTGLVAA